MSISDCYQTLISDPSTLESAIQLFLEEHSELIPEDPFRLGHGIWLNTIITKFPLDTSLITDFAMLTKDSGTWRAVLFELERASFPLFTGDIDDPQPTAQFTQRLTQVARWQDFIATRSEEVRQRLIPLLGVQKNLPMEFKYVLIVGRRSSLSNPISNRLFMRLSTDDLRVMTHDTLLSWLSADPNLRKNVLSLQKSHYKFKRLICPCRYIFGSLTPTEIELLPRHLSRLTRHGFDIDGWRNGERLDSLGKRMSDHKGAILESDFQAQCTRLYADTLDV